VGFKDIQTRLRSILKTMPRAILPPHLMTVGGIKRCSACQYAFDLKAEQSLGAAFRKHIEQVHRSSEKFDDVKLTAPGVVKKKTK
jgi:hypothetical protein